MTDLAPNNAHATLLPSLKYNNFFIYVATQIIAEINRVPPGFMPFEVDLRDDVILISILLVLSTSACQASEENDLWLLLSSYEDIGITIEDLAFFLATHGFNAKPSSNDSYVTVVMSSGKEVYLTPNGASPRLADLWMTPPTSKSGPVQVIPGDAIKINASYVMADDEEFIKAVSRYIMFPVTPLGMCYDGSEKLDSTYSGAGYHVVFLYDPSGFNSQGHLWIAVEDKSRSDTWLAVDSYYGVMTDKEYYSAPYSFSEFQYLDSINPKWRLV